NISVGKGLGRGLNAIFSQNSNISVTEHEEVAKFEIALEDIELNPYQPRTYFDQTALNELKVSIQKQGIIQPIAVRQLPNGKYQLISGERRFQASKLAGLKSIPAYIRLATNIQMLEMGIIENIQRENLNAVEIALSFRRLLEECNIKQEELADRVGKDRSTVNNYLRLLQLPNEILEGIKLKKITMGHARAILGLDNKTLFSKIYKEILDKQLSVRKVEELVHKTNAAVSLPTNLKKDNKPKKRNLEGYELALKDFFKVDVKVLADPNSTGEIKISFSSKNELEAIIKLLKKKK
ncbi:MAG: ParB/RepB/Spo0J family partition protein, partial [Leadbetterella sp.]